jgi:hypothetical protein
VIHRASTHHTVTLRGRRGWGSGVHSLESMCHPTLLSRGNPPDSLARDVQEKKPPRSKSPASLVDEGLPKNGKSKSGTHGDPASSAAPPTPTPASAVPGRGVPPLGREAQAPPTPASGDRTGDKDARSPPEATPGKPPKGSNQVRPLSCPGRAHHS